MTTTTPTDTSSPLGDQAAGYAEWLTATAGLATTTARTYTGHLRDFTRWWTTTRPGEPLIAAKPTDIEAYLVHLTARGLRPSTRRTALHALRAYYRWTARHAQPDTGQAPQNPAASVRRPRVPKPHTVIYAPAEADAVLHAAATTARHAGRTPTGGEDRLGTRRWLLDHAVLATLRWTGLRASEVCGLRLADLDLTEATVHVNGKGSKHRQVPLPAPLLPILRRYLTDFRDSLNTHPANPGDRLFLNPASARPELTHRALWDICRKHGDAAGVPGPHRPLRWRHTYSTHTLALGVDLHSLSRLLGHASVSTTQRYVHLQTADLHAALARAYGAADPIPEPPDASGEPSTGSG